MKKRFLNIAGAILVVICLASTQLYANTTYADARGEACNGIGGCAEGAGGGISLNSVITAVVNILSLVVGVVAVIMIIVGGFKYITSNGDSNAISSAKNTIIYALIGLVIVALAQTLVKFVLNKVTKAGG